MLRFVLICVVVVGLAFIGVATFSAREHEPVTAAPSQGPSAPARPGPTAPAAAPARSVSVDSSPAAPTSPAPLRPHVEVAQTEHDFGVVQPLATYRHAFTIHNTGQAPLELTGQQSSCKCLRVEVPSPVIGPSETGQVVLAWDAKESQDAFYQTALLQTNDPEQPEIRFAAYGRVLLLLASDPPTLSAPRVTPGEQATVDTTIVSQTWDAFEIHSIHSSLEGATWELSPASQAEIARLKSKSGWRLAVTLPDDLPEGNFMHWLRFKAAPVGGEQDAAEEIEKPALATSDSFISVPAQEALADASAELEERELLLEGKVLRRLAVYGDDIDATGTIDAGIVTSSQGYEGQFLLRVNDRDKQLSAAAIDADPDFVEVKVEPYSQEKNQGLYRMWVRIPAARQSGIYRGDQRGKITIRWDHPRIDELHLGLEFVMAGSTSRFGAGGGISSARSR